MSVLANQLRGNTTPRRTRRRKVPIYTYTPIHVFPFNKFLVIYFVSFSVFSAIYFDVLDRCFSVCSTFFFHVGCFCCVVSTYMCTIFTYDCKIIYLFVAEEREY